jgi:uncharacterized protein YndB with AHSA1/START domain
MTTATARSAATSATDCIERSVLVHAPRARVWQALTTAEEFGTWFGANLKGQTFAPGQRVRGPMDGSCGHDNVMFDVVVDRIEPQDLFSYRWHPAAIEPGADYSGEERTLVTFTLQDAPGKATRLTVVESGFDKVDPKRRREAFRMNSGGWDAQIVNLVRHVGA